jgi:hypothetical protein
MNTEYIFVLQSHVGDIITSYYEEPSEEQMDIDYCRYLKQDLIESGSASWNCNLYRIVVEKSVEVWHGRYIGSKYNWISNE